MNNLMNSSPLYLLLIALLSFSCKTDDPKNIRRETSLEITHAHNLALLEGSDIINFSEIQQVNGMLQFASMDHFHQVLDQLTVLDANWVDEYVPDEEDYVIPDEALEAFENSLEFYSLRKFIEQDEEAFLLSGNEDWESRLEATHFIGDDYERALLNPGSEVKIGSSIYKHISEELIIEITDGNMATFESAKAYFQDQKDFSTDIPADMGTGNVKAHYTDYSITIFTSGSSVELCPDFSTERLRLNWDGVGNGSNDLSVNLSDNVPLILAKYNGLKASIFDLTVSNFDGSNTTYILINFPGHLSHYTHIFNEPGAYKICLTQHFTDKDGNYCGKLTACDTVITGSCCQSNDYVRSEMIYANGERKIEFQSRAINNLFHHKLWAKTKNFKSRGNDRWKSEKADMIRAGFVGGSGGSVYYKRNSGGQCNIPIPMSGFNYSETRNDRVNVSYSFKVPHSHSQSKFYLHSGSVASFHEVDDHNDDALGILRMTDNCE